MPVGIVIIIGLRGLMDMFCSSDTLKKKVNNEGAYSAFNTSTCAGVMNIKKDRKKISE
tara:strand:+ start:72 stop:245 length:174 start_codon:yes stop_codon:yes gene_type:complete